MSTAKAFVRHLRLGQAQLPAVVSIEADSNSPGRLHLAFQPSVTQADLQEALRQVTAGLLYAKPDNRLPKAIL